MKSSRVILQNNLKQFRERKGLTQVELSERCNYEKSYIGKIERGAKSPSFETIIRIAEELDVSIEQLLTPVPQENDTDSSELSLEENGGTVLIIEDNPADAQLIERGLEDLDQSISTDVIQDGLEAKEKLLNGDVHPTLILLDYFLPGMEGLELLDELKADESTREIPVIVLTQSQKQDLLHKAYEKGASCFLTKPNSSDEFEELVQGLESFWLHIAELPSQS